MKTKNLKFSSLIKNVWSITLLQVCNAPSASEDIVFFTFKCINFLAVWAFEADSVARRNTANLIDNHYRINIAYAPE